jgi:hypothetical protein
LKKFIIPVAIVAGLAVASSADAAPRLQTFGTGDVAVTAGTVTINNAAGEYGGVYLNSRSLNNKPIGDVVVSFTATGHITGGAPRVNIPIDADGDKKIDLYATLDAANTPHMTDEDVWVSTENSATPVYFLDANTGNDADHTAYYANWDAFVDAQPGYRVAGAIPFIIADQEGAYTLENIDLQ